MSEERSEAETYPLEPPLAFLQQLWRLNQALERLSTSMERRLEITAQQRLVLRCVGKFPGITSGALADLLHLDPGTVSSMVHRLVGRKLLERRRDPKDGRRYFLGLSDRGRVLAKPTGGTVERAAELLLKTTSVEEIALSLRVVSKLTVLLEDEALSPEKGPGRAKK